jgi:hypothetical protein
MPNTTKIAILSLLHIFAAPIYTMKWLLRLTKVLRSFRAARAGWLDCPHCGTRNALNILATCRRCGTTEFGSRLFCGNCRQITRAFPCDVCMATIRVL